MCVCVKFVTAVPKEISTVVTCCLKNFVVNIIRQVIYITDIFVYKIPDLSDLLNERNIK